MPNYTPLYGKPICLCHIQTMNMDPNQQKQVIIAVFYAEKVFYNLIFYVIIV